MAISKLVPVAVLSLLLLSASFCKAVASPVPWCAPEIAVLTFKEQKGGGAAKIEIRSTGPICTYYGAERATSASLERSMRIEYKGEWIEVPASCVAGVSFRLDELSLSFGDAGVAIRIYGKSSDRGEKMTVAIYIIGSKVLC